MWKSLQKLKYTDRSTVDRLEKWLQQELSDINISLARCKITVMKDEPFSLVLNVCSQQGFFYLKHTPPDLFIESSILNFMHEKVGASVPEVIASCDTLSVFLMHDAGVTLRNQLKEKFDVNMAWRGINEFIVLQNKSISHIDALLALGVPDYRLDTMMVLFERMIAHDALLCESGLMRDEILRLHALVPVLRERINQLIEIDIAQTVVQPDCNDNNILFDSQTGAISIIDLGEIVISHPFFPLLNFLFQMRKHHGLSEQMATYQQLKGLCFRNAADKVGVRNCERAIALANQLWPIYAALAMYRLMLACGIEKIQAYQPGKLADILRLL